MYGPGATDPLIQSLLAQNAARMRPDNLPTQQQIAQILLGMAPGAGDVMSAMDSQRSGQGMVDAFRAGDYGRAASSGIEALGAALGALPGIPGFGAMMRSVSPDSLIFREANQHRLEQVREMFGGDPLPPVSAVETNAGLEILDGHNRTALALERGDNLIDVSSVTKSEYKALRDAGFDDLEISYASLMRDELYNEAAALNNQFPGAGISQRGEHALSILDGLSAK